MFTAALVLFTVWLDDLFKMLVFTTNLVNKLCTFINITMAYNLSVKLLKFSCCLYSISKHK